MLKQPCLKSSVLCISVFWHKNKNLFENMFEKFKIQKKVEHFLINYFSYFWTNLWPIPGLPMELIFKLILLPQNSEALLFEFQTDIVIISSTITLWDQDLRPCPFSNCHVNAIAEEEQKCSKQLTCFGIKNKINNQFLKEIIARVCKGQLRRCFKKMQRNCLHFF